MGEVDAVGAVGEVGEVIYVYTWGNNPKRKTLKGRQCRVLARGTMNSAMVEFIDNGQREVISRNAIRRVTAGNKESSHG